MLSSLHYYMFNKQYMKEDKSLEYHIKGLEHMIRSHRAVKNEAKLASVGRKMFALNFGVKLTTGMYVISDDRYLIGGLAEAVKDLWRDGYTVHEAVEILCRNDATIIDKPCSIADRPTVMSYGDYLDVHAYEDGPELPHFDDDDLVFVDKNEQVHELEFLK